MSACCDSVVADRAIASVCHQQPTKSRASGPFVCHQRSAPSLQTVYTEGVTDEPRNYLRAWRQKAGLTLEELADKVGTTRSVVSLLENEKRPLSAKWLRKFADALGTTPGRILDVDPNEADAEVLDIWDHIATKDRARAVRVLRSLTGTND